MNETTTTLIDLTDIAAHYAEPKDFFTSKGMVPDPFDQYDGIAWDKTNNVLVRTCMGEPKKNTKPYSLVDEDIAMLNGMLEDKRTAEATWQEQEDYLQRVAKPRLDRAFSFLQSLAPYARHERYDGYVKGNAEWQFVMRNDRTIVVMPTDKQTKGFMASLMEEPVLTVESFVGQDLFDNEILSEANAAIDRLWHEHVQEKTRRSDPVLGTSFWTKHI